MSDEEIIKQRLLIDGDGTGDDRRLNMFLKQLLKWETAANDSPENNQIIYDRLLAQLAQIEFAAVKNEHTLEMIERENANYKKLSALIERSIEAAHVELEDCKKELVVAKEVRRNKMQYDLLARVIKEQPDRKETSLKIAELKKDIAALEEKKAALDVKLNKRRNDFALLMYSLEQLEAQLKEEDGLSDEDDNESTGSVEVKQASGEEDVEDDDEEEVASRSRGSRGDSREKRSNRHAPNDEDEDGPSTSKRVKSSRSQPAVKEERRESRREVETRREAETRRSKPAVVDLDEILELSLDKDDVQMEGV